MSTIRTRKRNGSAIAVLIIACVTAGSLIAGLKDPDRSSSAGGPQGSLVSRADPNISYVADLASEERQVFALTWRGDDEVWFVGSRGDGSMRLYRIDRRSGVSQGWDLPAQDSPGPNTFLADAGGGAWWIAANYTILRFDPDSADSPLIFVLDRTDPLAIPAASDPEAPSPGSWINGIAPEGNSLLVTRHNVRALYRFEAAGEWRAIEELSQPAQGLVSIDGASAIVVARPANVDRTQSGLLLHASEPGEVVAGGDHCTVALLPESGQVVVRGASSTVGLAVVPVRAGDRAAVAETGTRFALGLSGAGSLVRGDCAAPSTALEWFPLEVRESTSDTGTLRGGHMLQNLGASFLQIDQVLAVAISPVGHLAFSDSRMRVGVID